MVSHDFVALVENCRDFSFLGDIPAFRAGRVVYTEADVLDPLFFHQGLDTLFQLRIVRQEHNAGFDGLVAGNRPVQFLDQTGQAVVQLTGEDERDGSAAELSDKAILLTVLGRLIHIDDVERMECSATILPDLRAGFQATLGQHQTTCQYGRQASLKDANAHG